MFTHMQSQSGNLKLLGTFQVFIKNGRYPITLT